MDSIILMGIKHCGKSAQGKLLSKKLNLPFYDIDDLIEKNTGKTPREIFTANGEQAFKDAETEACKKLYNKLHIESKDAVIATGGGICNNQKALDVLHPLGKFYFLCTSSATATERVMREAKIAADGTPQNLPAYIAKKNPRTMKEAREIFLDFFRERVKIYESICDVKVLMTDGPKDENTEIIIKAL